MSKIVKQAAIVALLSGSTEGSKVSQRSMIDLLDNSKDQ